MPSGVHVGDRINIVDDDGELYLSGRVLKLVTSIVSDKKTVTFGEWRVKTSGISEKVKELAEKFKTIADTRTFYTWFVYADDTNGTNMTYDPEGKSYMGIAANKLEPEPEDPTTLDPSEFNWSACENVIESVRDEISTLLRIESSRGTVFKNAHVETVLSVVIYHGKTRIVNSTELAKTFGSGAYLQWKWQRLDDSSFGIVSASDPRIGNNGFTFTLTPKDVNTKVTFMCELIV